MCNMKKNVGPWPQNVCMKLEAQYRNRMWCRWRNSMWEYMYIPWEGIISLYITIIYYINMWCWTIVTTVKGHTCLVLSKFPQKYECTSYEWHSESKKSMCDTLYHPLWWWKAGLITHATTTLYAPQLFVSLGRMTYRSKIMEKMHSPLNSFVVKNMSH